MLELSNNFTTKESQKLLFNVDFWEEVSITQVNAILECSAATNKEVASMVKRYRQKRNDIVFYVGSQDVYEGDTTIPQSQRLEASRLMQLIAIHFLSEFPKLIKSSLGGEVLSIPEQINNEVKAANELAINKLFGDDVRLSEHAYYVVGFLCYAGMKEKERRSKKNDIGRCIEKACSHYLTAGDSKLEDLKKKLPTGLVDRRIALGGLKYPDEEFYKTFGIIERAYSKVVTPDNFMARGGMLLAEIRDAMVQNEILFSQFTALLGNHQFEEATIQESFAYFVKVFCNLRAKDIALKYNSNLNGSNTVGLRQTLAGGIALNKKKKRKSAKKADEKTKYEKMKVPELKALCRTRKLPVGGIKKVLIERLEAFDLAQEDDGNSDEEDDNAEDEEDDTAVGNNGNAEDDIHNNGSSDDSEHNAMLSACNDIDSQRDDDYNSAEKVSSRDIIADKVENDM